MDKIISILKSAGNNLRVNKIRSIFTVIGIVIGIATVTVVVSVGEGFKAYIVQQVQNFGSNTLFVEARPPDNISFTIITTLKEKQVEEIRTNKKLFPHIQKAYPYLGTQNIARSRYEEITVDITGTNEDFIDIDSAEIAEGRFFTNKENQSLNHVVVLGHTAAEKLFPAGNALGSDLKVGNVNLKIVGVLKEKGPDLMMNMDKMVFMPLKLMKKNITGVDYILYFAAQVDDSQNYEETKDQIRSYLRAKHNLKPDNEDDFAITTAEEAVDMVNAVLWGVSILLLSIAFISLLVGGIGIMNIMYVTVSERIREIGIRKAVGATARDILYQFLAEAVIVTFIGALLGIIFGITLTWIIVWGAAQSGLIWPFIISGQAILVSIIVAGAFGFIFGLAPARRAANQDPIMALRFE